uniref:Uncharacterized protein n=1 Tax=Eutreptiella gymnastica TaxID=73025 RepID=A0A7S4D3E8_9EUGL
MCALRALGTTVPWEETCYTLHTGPVQSAACTSHARPHPRQPSVPSPTLQTHPTAFPNEGPGGHRRCNPAARRGRHQGTSDGGCGPEFWAGVRGLGPRTRAGDLVCGRRQWTEGVWTGGVDGGCGPGLWADEGLGR